MNNKMNNYQTALSEMEKLDKIDTTIVIMNLLRSGKLDFVDLANHYITVLEERVKNVDKDCLIVDLYKKQPME